MPWRLDTENVEWVDEAGNIPRINLEQAGDLVDQLIDTVNEDEVDEILDILSDSPTEEETQRWKSSFWLLLKVTYLALAFVAAAGALSVSELENVQILLQAQLFYLDRFAQEVAAGAISKPEARRRMRMYVNSSRSAFWTVLDREMRDAGYTEERWDAIGDRNTCSPCTEADMMGWQPIGTFGEPGSGYVLRNPTTECAGLSSCRCRKEYRQ